MLMGLSVAVFLAGCLNLANLQAGRLAARSQGFSVRMSLGATRWQLLRQTLMEDGLVTIAGGALAFLIGRSFGTALPSICGSSQFRPCSGCHLGLVSMRSTKCSI